MDEEGFSVQLSDDPEYLSLHFYFWSNDLRIGFQTSFCRSIIQMGIFLKIENLSFWRGLLLIMGRSLQRGSCGERHTH
jgi:hypothetical protein